MQSAVPRIAIYARYSSDLQNPTSVDDQISHCLALLERQFGVTDQSGIRTFSDSAISGSTMERPGLKAMLGAAASGGFDLLIAEGLDRLSRSLKDMADIFERLRYYGVALWTAHEGNVGPLHIGMKGTMNALYLEDMRAKVRRGQQARIEAGFAASSPPYGYRVVRGVVDEKMRNVNGVREVFEPQASVVRRIFEQFADGVGTKEIVRDLNDEGVPSPTGRLWRPGRLLGSRAKGEGILRNEQYRGYLVYNRTRLVTDPLTGRKRYVPNPPDDWFRKEVPELRIVPEDVWRAVRERDVPRKWKTRTNKPEPLPVPAEGEGFRYNQRPLTGLVKCGVCGGQKSVANETRYLCSTNRYTRKCKNARGTREAVLKEQLFADLRHAIETNSAVLNGIKQAYKRDGGERDKNLTTIADIDGRIERLLTAIERGVAERRVTAKICDLQVKRALLVQQNERLVKEVPSDDDVRSQMIRAVDHLDTRFFDQEMAVTIHTVLMAVVREVTLRPVAGKATGESIRIAFRPAGWAELWRFACGL